MAGFTRRVLHRAAVRTHLQVEATQTAVVRDHSEAHGHPKAGVRNGAGEIAIRQLSYRFDQTKKSGRAAGLADRELSATCIDRKSAVIRKGVTPHERWAVPFS